LDNIVGRDHRMQRVYDLVDAVADNRTTVLIVGESGTGKSMLARAIHRRSSRRNKPFVEISCGALPESLLETELFGHVKGSFTGAVADKPGRFLTADTGTIFLDEINSAPLSMQVKLLRVLQERCFEPVGATETKSVDVRTILASNVDLQTLVASGQFRQDLYYRINVVTIQLPPLRTRNGDVPMLAEHFMRQFSQEAGRKVIGFSDETMQQLIRYPWPGNVRELENVVERAVVLCRRPKIEIDDLPDALRGADMLPAPTSNTRSELLNESPMPLEKALETPERLIIEAALKRNNWNRQATAAELDINRTTLYKKMRKHGLDVGSNN
ncbi:MAG: sigma-54-dependent Fis family transcriptional regulator, partial [Burkholderiales bacterium]|nr:sigma-54-dependent Fis family transcriptional regulator [Phycisphaerae bacterium]